VRLPTSPIVQLGPPPRPRLFKIAQIDIANSPPPAFKISTMSIGHRAMARID
jgi:hypothetical protein